MDKAIAWHEANQQLIAESLPLTVDGVTFRQEWQERFDGETLPKYKAGRLSGGVGHRLCVADTAAGVTGGGEQKTSS